MFSYGFYDIFQESLRTALELLVSRKIRFAKRKLRKLSYEYFQICYLKVENFSEENYFGKEVINMGK